MNSKAGCKAPAFRLWPLLAALALLAFSAGRVPSVSADATGTSSCTARASGSCSMTFTLDGGNEYTFDWYFSLGSVAGQGITFYIVEPNGNHYDSLTDRFSESVSINANPPGTECGPPPDGAGCPTGQYVLNFVNPGSTDRLISLKWTHITGGAAFAIPEFPPELVLSAAVALVVVASYVLSRRSSTA